MLILLLGAAILLSPQSPGNSPSGPSQVSGKSTTQTGPSAQNALEKEPSPPTLNNGKQPTTQQQNSTAYTPEDGRPTWEDKVSAYSTLAIAFFTALTIGVFAFQIQTAHDVERAWIAVTNDEFPRIFEWDRFPPEERKRGMYSFTLKNHGRTPARVISARVRFHSIRNISDLPELPAYGDAKATIYNVIPRDGKIVVPGEEFYIGALFEGTEDNPGLNALDESQWRNHQVAVICYGYVGYKDAFHRRHETRFCYEVRNITDFFASPPRDNPQSSVSGPPEYNKAT
jgi:hypothetical protein